MDHHFIKTQGKTLLILKVAGNLYLDSCEGEDLQVQSNPRDLKIQVDEEPLRVTTYGNCTISVPQQIVTRVEKVGGNAFIHNIHSKDFYVQRVGGNISIQNVDDLTLSRVGGSCQVKEVNGRLSIERVSGELYVADVAGEVNVQSARADATVLKVRGEANVSASGDIIFQSSADAVPPLSLRSKGDITLFLPQNSNANINAVYSGWDVVLTMAGKTENYGGGSYQGQIGEGGSAVNLFASGDIVITDELFDLPPEPTLDEDGAPGEFNFTIDTDGITFGGNLSDAYQRRLQKAMGKVEAKLRKMEGKFSDAQRRMAEQQDGIAQRIEERARLRAQRAEEMADLRVQKRVHEETMEALEKVQEELRNLNLPIGLPPLDFIKDIKIPSVPPMPEMPDTPAIPGIPNLRSGTAPAKPQAERDATHEERMMILAMLKDGTITVQEAETLLAALKGS